jgi:hypothetical protein
VTINILPDDVLLEVFGCYMSMSQAQEVEEAEAWQTLVHVCQKWRWVVFRSPRRLNLQLVCRSTTPVREMLDIWPPLPIIIQEYKWPMSDMDNIVVALEHNDRIRGVFLCGRDWQLEKVLEVMRKPFPALTELQLGSESETEPADPDLFLGGSAPGLRYLRLRYIPFQGLPKLLSAATHLTDLFLSNIPFSGYISPEAMMTGISALTRLETLFLEFEYPPPFPDGFPYGTSQRPPPPTRTLLPALISMTFGGESGYLEHLVAGIDAPLLDHLTITFFPQLSFDTPRLTRFVSHTPSLRLHDEAHISFSNWAVHVTLPRPFSRGLKLYIVRGDSNWGFSDMIQCCTSFISQAISPVVKRLYIINYQEYILERERERPVVGLFTSIWRCGGSIPIPRNYKPYCARSARARWRRSDRSLAWPAESFLGSSSIAIPGCR